MNTNENKVEFGHNGVMNIEVNMRKAFMKKMKGKLEQERMEILKSIEEAKKSEVDVSGDELDRIQAQILSRSISELAVRNQNRVLQITNALKRINDGIYGECLQCNENIDEKRLAINPSFFLCAGCSEWSELKRKGIVK